jgi:tetratricopeptide (TPR) repeat protein
MKRWVTYGVMLLWISAASAGDIQSLFEQGNTQFKNEQYRDAIASYTQILDQGIENTQLYYNLGNAYYKSGEVAKAILNYERALRLSPRDSDIQANLDLANHHIVDRVETAPMLFFWHWVNAIRDGMTAEEWGKWSVIGLWVAMAVTILAIFRRRGLFRRQIRWLAGVLMIAWICIFAAMIWKVERDRIMVYAIVMEEKIEILGAPDETGTVLFDLHEGVKVRVLREVPGWTEIALPDPNKKGWLPTETFEII